MLHTLIIINCMRFLHSTYCYNMPIIRFTSSSVLNYRNPCGPHLSVIRSNVAPADVVGYCRNSAVLEGVELFLHSFLTSTLCVWTCWGVVLLLCNSHFSCTRVGTLIVATIYLQLIHNRYMFRSFTILQCSHQHCVQPVARDAEVVGYI